MGTGSVRGLTLRLAQLLTLIAALCLIPQRPPTILTIAATECCTLDTSFVSTHTADAATIAIDRLRDCVAPTWLDDAETVEASGLAAWRSHRVMMRRTEHKGTIRDVEIDRLAQLRTDIQRK